MSDKIVVKLIRDHSKDCPHHDAKIRKRNPNMIGFWLNTYEPEMHVNRSATGRNTRGAYYRWIGLSCAWRKECTALALVRVDTLEELINEAIDKAR